MHADQVDAGERVVRALLAEQAPDLAGLPLTPVASGGTSNALFRLGGELAVRLPLRASSAGQVAKEQRWLPVLAPVLPLPVPRPVLAGAPGAGYPFAWSVVTWLPGADALAAPPRDWSAAAEALGAFVRALHAADPVGGPPPGDHNFHRGVPLADRDDGVRAAIEAVSGDYDAAALTAAWEAALAAPVGTATTWIHGDLQAGNVLTSRGAVSAVVDFGGLGVGDPACDVMAAWLLLPAGARAAFRDAVGADDAAWARGKGWALSAGLVALPYYRTTNPVMVRIARQAIEAVLAER